ncbi:uncharacterized protein LOC132619708, partial [Lycium barbarum]|uniref:uncharacterized protein LOC132619708 n=1 Tax=Lycium barbarum TaxID=112863 RepID=UPI00293EAB0D
LGDHLHQFYNNPSNEYVGKLVLKPLAPERRWKFICETLHCEVRLLSKKIPVTKFLNLQVGIGHNFQLHATGWKWKLTTCLGGDGVSRIRNKTSLGLCPGVDFCFGWRADYVLPEITGRGLSSFYAGKSKSYTSLADAASSPSLKDMVKPDNAYTRKRKNLLAHSNFFDKNRNHFPRINRVG